MRAMNTVTRRVIYWLDHHHYSAKHWQEIADDCLEKNKGNLSQAIHDLAESLKGFHCQFRDAVVKSDNVLYEFISLAFTEVNWFAVAASRYPQAQWQEL